MESAVAQLAEELAAIKTQIIHGGRVANAFGCNAIEVTGSRPSFGDISEIHFSRINTEGLKMVYVTLREFTVNCNVSGDNWGKKLPCYQDRPLY